MQNLSSVFTRELIEDCILNSKMFRDMIIDKFMEDNKISTLHAELLAEMNVHYVYQADPYPYGWNMNTITFIKRIREMSKNRAFEFRELFPTIINSEYSKSDTDMIGLADAKRLSEHYIDNYLVTK